VNQILGDSADAGLVGSDGGRLVIINLDRLRGRAGW
jgi:hypothetical protein